MREYPGSSPGTPCSYTSTMPSPLGKIVMQCDETGLRRVFFSDQGNRPPASGCLDPRGILDATRQWLESYFAGKRPNQAALPLSLRGTPYQLSVWRLLLQMNYGQRCSYGDLCRALSMANLPPGSPRAAGAAVGRNPIGVIIPCHRVLGATGKLVGFAAGLWRKEWLLNHEAQTTFE